MTARLSGTILQVIPELEIGGAERTTLEIAEAIINAGGTAIVASQGGQMVEPLEALGATHINLPVASKNPITMQRNIGRLKKVIRTHHVDLVHVRSRAPAWSCLRAAKECGRPFVTTYHGVYSANNSWKRRYNGVMAQGDVVIANSDYTRHHVIEQHYPKTFSDLSKLITIHRGADMRRFDPAAMRQERIEAIEKEWQGAGSLKILLPGRLTSWKGQVVLIQAAQILRISHPMMDVRIVLAGSAQGRTEYEAQLHTLARTLQVDHMVTIPGNCSDMPAAYAWADLVVSASTRPEAFGRVAVEAQAMGTPVIATNHGGACETVLPEETGYLVPPADAQSLALAISAFADLDQEARLRMGAQAKRHVNENFSVESMTQATLNVYNEALKSNNR